MPRQPRQPVNRPYTKLLSTLWKPELVRLCTEFELPFDGSVSELRDRAKQYLTQNNEVLYRNPRFRPLYPNIRRINQRSPTLSSTLKSPPRIPSPTPSFDSWNGIEDINFQQLPIQPDDLQHPLPQPQPQCKGN